MSNNRRITVNIFSEQATCSDYETILCESNGYNYQECFVDGIITAVEVEEKISDSHCTFYPDAPPPPEDKEGEGIWGYVPGSSSFWTHRGCRAYFFVCFSGKYEDHRNHTHV